jgi:GntR family transcriptional regulator/MocR family aminotransferase
MDLHLALPRGRRGVRHGLEHELRIAIQERRLLEGARLPSTRALADQLGISRGVVVDAYSQLCAEGYLTARVGAGTVVARAVDLQPTRQLRETKLPLRYDFRPGVPDLSAFPRRAWARAISDALTSVPDARLGYGDPQGALELRAALASYLGRTRGAVASSDRILVVGGLGQGLNLLWPVLGARGIERIGVERPGWYDHRTSVSAAGLSPVDVTVDTEGMRTDQLGSLRSVVVTPAHQFPTGAVLAATRRAQLVNWAKGADGFIVEDDYDAQYRFDGKPVGAVQGLVPEHTVHGGTVSKLLAPALRLGWLLLPENLVEPLTLRKRQLDRGVPLLEQLALARLIETGGLDRHLRRTRRVYARRRQLLLEGLARQLPELPVEGAAAGLHIFLPLPDQVRVGELTDRAAAAGIAIRGIQRGRAGLALGFANLPDAAFAPAISTLRDVLRAALRESGA